MKDGFSNVDISGDLDKCIFVKQRKPKPHWSGFNAVRGEMKTVQGRQRNRKVRSMEDFRIWFFSFVFETLNIIAYLHDE